MVKLAIVDKTSKTKGHIMATNWTKLYKDYKGLWVALKSDEVTVIASGKKLRDVKFKAENSGYKKPIYTKVPKKNLAYIGKLK